MESLISFVSALTLTLTTWLGLVEQSVTNITDLGAIDATLNQLTELGSSTIEELVVGEEGSEPTEGN